MPKAAKKSGSAVRVAQHLPLDQALADQAAGGSGLRIRRFEFVP